MNAMRADVERAIDEAAQSGNETNNTATISPGYVIRLPASRAEGAPMIEGNVSP